MRTAFFTLMAAICWMSSCKPQHADTQGSTGTTNSRPTDVTFEIKNLTLTSTPRKSYITPSKTESWDYKAHAIVTTKVESLQQGMVVVGLEHRATPPSTSGSEEWEKEVSLLRDGIGEIEFTITYDVDRYKDNPGPPKLEWRVLGYVPLVPAKVSVE
jgi:hypothetical protein